MLLDSNDTKGTVAIAGIDWYPGSAGPDNQAQRELCIIGAPYPCLSPSLILIFLKP
jgi:hypothetical protein